MSLSQLHCYKYWVNEVHNYSLLTDQKDYCQQAKAIIPFVNIGKRKEKNEVKANKFGLVAIQFCEHTHLKGLTLLAHVIANLLNHVFKNKSYIINTLSLTHEMQGRGGGEGDYRVLFAFLKNRGQQELWHVTFISNFYQFWSIPQARYNPWAQTDLLH